MTAWDFLNNNLTGVVLSAVVLFYALFRFVGFLKGRGIKIGPTGVEVSAAVDKYSVEGLMLENQVLRQITRQIADLETRILLQRQMTLVDEYIEALVNQVNDAFRKYLAEKGTKSGEFYDDAIHDNDRVMSETRKNLTNRLRVAMRQNGFAHKTPGELREYVRDKFEKLHAYANEIRMDVAFDEEIVGSGFIAWNAGAAVKYHQQTLELFQRCGEVTLDCENKIGCLQAEYKHVEKVFRETGTVPALAGVCFEE